MPRKKLLPTDLETQREFRKTNSVIAPRVVRGGVFNLLRRKIFNILLYHTQHQGHPGQNAPEGVENFRQFFWLQMSDLVRDANYGSNDTAMLKEALENIQDLRITVDNKTLYASDVLLQSVRIVPGNRRGATMLGWRFNDEVLDTLLSPAIYTRLSLHYLAILKSTAGLALYEITKRYATSPAGVTRREPWGWWYEALTGLPIGDEKPEYKYFKRDSLKTAIAEVNRVTDVNVELLEFRSGKFITDLQFQVSLKPQQQLELPAQPIIDSELQSRIEALGVHRREAEDLIAKHDGRELNAAADYVEKRLLNTKAAPVDSPAGYFRKALREGFAEGATNAQAVKQQRLERKRIKEIEDKEIEEKEIRERDRIAAEETELAKQQYEALPIEEQNVLRDEFMHGDYSSGIPNAKLRERAFHKFLRDRFFPKASKSRVI